MRHLLGLQTQSVMQWSTIWQLLQLWPAPLTHLVRPFHFVVKYMEQLIYNPITPTRMHRNQSWAWELVQNQTRLWLEHLRHTTSSLWLLTRATPPILLCLVFDCVSVLTGGVTANGSNEGSRVMAKLNYVHAICQWWPYHCFCLLTPSSVIMWLCFDMTVAMCMVCVCILLPIHALLQPDCSLMGEFQDIMNFELELS